MSRKNNSGFVIGALLGAAAGAIGGILLAPKKGEETRKELKEKINEYTDKAGKVIDEKTKDIREDAQKLSSSIKKTAKDKIEAIVPKKDEVAEETPNKPAKKTKRKYFKGV